MEERATGLILRVYPLTETSLVVHWLTEGQGRLATVARGARRPKSPFRGKLDLFFLADLSFHRSRHSELHVLREVGLRDAHPWLRQDLGRLQQAAYAAALIEHLTEKDTPLPEAYALLRGFLACLGQTPARPSLVHAFEIKWLAELGLLPDPSSSGLTPGTGQLIGRLLSFQWDQLGHLAISPAQQAEINGFLEHLLRTQLDRLPAARQKALSP
jgi:DNA repair protein RecO (recombination protein O)